MIGEIHAITAVKETVVVSSWKQKVAFKSTVLIHEEKTSLI